VITTTGVAALCVIVRDGVITELQPYDSASENDLIDTGDAVLMPGVVDTHVHLNDPGRSEWEGFDSGTRAAAAGGITTVVDMPLNSIPATTNVAGLALKRAAAQGRCHVDVAFWGGVVPGNAEDIGKMWQDGVLGFKCFLAPSGVDEFEHVDENDLRIALPMLAQMGAPLLVHAELPSRLLAVMEGARSNEYANYLATRPDAAEVEAVQLLLELSRSTGARIHFVHVASSDVLPILRAARAEGLPISAETCSHYLHFTAESIPDGGTQWKCAPPIRSAATRERLWQALMDGDLDLIASDHSPAPPGMKQPVDGSFVDAWGGIASLQLSLPVVWTGARARGVTLTQVSDWMAAAPARLAGLTHKGAIEVGRDADFVVFEPDTEWTVNAATLHHRHALTPYDGERLTGMVRATYVRGQLTYDAAAGHTQPVGRLIHGTTNELAWNSPS
jgi:allantoinase